MPPQAFWQGVEEFNQREFYACHDTLEALWMEATESDKSFYQGILQVAVGCYHLSNNNWRGAVTLLGEGIRRLSNYQPTYYNIDVSHLLSESFQLLTALQSIEPDEISQLVEHLEAANNTDKSSQRKRYFCQLPKIVRTD